jgi:tetratricopeptide (TPR) repeat protein
MSAKYMFTSMPRRNPLVYNEGIMNPIDPASSPSQVGSKSLARFTDTDSLFVRPEPTGGVVKSGPAIQLERFQQLEQEIRLSSAVAEPYVELAQIYLQRERWSDARRTLDAGIQNCPEHEPLVLLHEDLVLNQAAQFVEAAKTEHAQKRTAQSRFDLEQAEVNLVNLRIKVCKDRYQRHPDQKEILITWAIALRQAQRPEEATEILQEAAKELSLRSRASLQLGMCYQTLDRSLDALSAFRKASLFRSPEPDAKVAITALELAAKLAEEKGLIDSAIYYWEELAKRQGGMSDTIRQKIASLTPLLPNPPAPL